MTIAAYQGIDGAYSQLVLEHALAGSGVDTTLVGLDTFRAVAARVASGRAECGVIPVENAVAGTVREAYDLLAEFGLRPQREILWRLDHRLLGVPGASLQDVREILAHPLVIAECGRFLNSLPHARAIPCEDTGVAARDVARGGNTALAAIAPPSAASIYGLVEIADSVADDPQTYSRFWLFGSPASSAGPAEAERARKTSMILTLGDEPGILARCLQHLAAAQLNVTKLESKPRLGHGDQHSFYIDFEGDIADVRVAAAIAKIKADADGVRIIGSYDAHSGEPANAAAPAVSVPQAVPVSPPEDWLRVPPPFATSGLPKASRAAKPEGSSLRIGNVRVGDGEFVIIAGPCSVESAEQVLATAHAVRDAGAVMLRGGAFKPRTSPYAFQGLGWEGVALLAQAGRATGMPTVSEVMTIDQVERMAAHVDVLQIGARNMQNFDLLKAVGRTGHPVLLKRGLSATIDELLAAAEYILSEGNPNVMLCERGIRTYETATRNTLDLSAIPVLRERSHLPVLVDPSHAVGVRRWIAPMCRAAKAAGAHGLIVEVHPNPPEAKSDKEQALTFGDFEQIVRQLERIPIASDEAVAAK